ncbi:hypothetical protein ACRAWD_18010 [Caulobacter segnis]
MRPRRDRGRSCCRVLTTGRLRAPDSGVQNICQIVPSWPRYQDHGRIAADDGRRRNPTREALAAQISAGGVPFPSGPTRRLRRSKTRNATVLIKEYQTALCEGDSCPGRRRAAQVAVRRMGTAGATNPTKP